MLWLLCFVYVRASVAGVCILLCVMSKRRKKRAGHDVVYSAAARIEKGWRVYRCNNLELVGREAKEKINQLNSVLFVLCSSCCFVSLTVRLSITLTNDQLDAQMFNPLKPELNSICYLLALLGARHFLHVSRIRVKLLTFRLLMSYIYIYIWSTHSWCF